MKKGIIATLLAIGFIVCSANSSLARCFEEDSALGPLPVCTSYAEATNNTLETGRISYITPTNDAQDSHSRIMLIEDRHIDDTVIPVVKIKESILGLGKDAGLIKKMITPRIGLRIESNGASNHTNCITALISITITKGDESLSNYWFLGRGYQELCTHDNGKVTVTQHWQNK